MSGDDGPGLTLDSFAFQLDQEELAMSPGLGPPPKGPGHAQQHGEMDRLSSSRTDLSFRPQGPTEPHGGCSGNTVSQPDSRSSPTYEMFGETFRVFAQPIDTCEHLIQLVTEGDLDFF